MGKKVQKHIFDQQDFIEFQRRVRQETDLLQEWFKGHFIEDQEKESGFELEMWLLTENYKVSDNNLSFIEKLKNRGVVSEVAQSCLEVNFPYDTLHNHTLARHEKRFHDILKSCYAKAKEDHQHIITIGTLPTASSRDFTARHLTEEHRYYAINRQLRLLRNHVATCVHIQGRETFDSPIQSFSMIGALSSFQIHFRIGVTKSARLYNASLIMSAPMVALSANSPYLFGTDLWDESRIPFFEQVLAPCMQQDRHPRVTFGNGYVKHSLLELFIENASCYAPLLPQVMEDPSEKMLHVQLHNGSIYRWNRPVIGFNASHVPHVRIEHRPLSSGPSVLDMIANAAFYYGVTQYYTETEIPLESEIPFSIAESNFYQAARFGLMGEVLWRGNKKMTIQSLILEHLLPQAKEGLRQLDLDPSSSDYYLSIVAECIPSRCR